MQSRVAWVRSRKAVQALALIVFIGLFVLSRRDGLPGDLANIPMRLDPLLVLASTLAARAFMIGSAAGPRHAGADSRVRPRLVRLAVSARDHAGPVPREGRARATPGRAGGVCARSSTSCSSSSCSRRCWATRPCSSSTRWRSSSEPSPRPSCPSSTRSRRRSRHSWRRSRASTDPSRRWTAAIRPLILPAEPVSYQDALLFASFFVALVALNALAPRFWCRYLCPLGGLLGLISRVAVFRREVTVSCRSCGLCAEDCPTGTIDPARGHASDPAECTVCMGCVETARSVPSSSRRACPSPRAAHTTPDGVSFSWRPAPPRWEWPYSAAISSPSASHHSFCVRPGREKPTRIRWP